MKKIYLSILLVIALVASSFMSGEGDTPLMEGKVTHFYPNPATSYINFTFDKSVDKSYVLQIYNFIGRKMIDARITDQKITITLDDSYLRGLYIYQLRDQSGRIVDSGKFQVSK